MEQGIVRNDRSHVVQDLIFSTKMRVGAVFVGLLIVSLGIFAVVSRPSLGESLAGIIIAIISSLATAMLWFRQRYALYSWALLAAVIGLAIALLNDPGHHSLLYWGGRAGSAVFLGWFAYLLLKLGRRHIDSR